MGIEPGRYIVGNELNSKNPVTGQPEFFLKQIGRRLRKAAADISGYAAPIAGAMFGPAAGAAVGVTAVPHALTSMTNASIKEIGHTNFFIFISFTNTRINF